jgi:hypothetical protein
MVQFLGSITPLIKGGQMKRYAILSPQRVVIFPYEQGELLSTNRMKQDFPLTWEYLKRLKPRLERRDRGGMKGPHWYGYSRNQALTTMPQRKIVTPEYYAHASYCLDEEGTYYFCGGGAGGYGIVLTDSWSYEYILALLNSRLLDWYLHKVSVRAYQTAYMYTKKYIAQIPIQPVNYDNPADVARHDKIVALAQKITDLRQKFRKTGAAARVDAEKMIAKANAEIDALVYELYGLTEKEIDIIEHR